MARALFGERASTPAEARADGYINPEDVAKEARCTPTHVANSFRALWKRKKAKRILVKTNRIPEYWYKLA